LNKSQDTTAVGSCSIIWRCAGVAVSNSGRKVSYIPPADLKSGIPAATDIPAPVKKATFLHASDWRNAATPATSRLGNCFGVLPTAELNLNIYLLEQTQSQTVAKEEMASLPGVAKKHNG
jgi:hypothetical protein